jgi:hypothetical protein
MMRMPTVPGVFFQSATTSATAGSSGSTGLTMANRPEWPVVRVARSTIRQSTSAVAITSRLLGLHHRYARIWFSGKTGHGVIAVGVSLDPIDQACFLNSSTRTRVFSL